MILNSLALAGTVLVLLGSQSAAQERARPCQFKSDKSRLTYFYSRHSDSTFILGELVEQSSLRPVTDINIWLKEEAIGTVPDLNGRFRLLLPKASGVIAFSKGGFESFEFGYTVGRCTKD
jgi:hypothetical protein